MENPILKRECRTLAASRRLQLFVVALAVILSATLLMLWPRTGIFSNFNSNEIFTVFLIGNLALLIITVPAFTATSIANERERGTFDLLFNTLLSPFEIAAGKMAAALIVGLALVGATMPISAVCALSGGIGTGFLMKMYGLVTLMTITYGMVGLATSSLCTRNISAVFATYSIIAIIAGAVWLPSVLLPQATALTPAWRLLRSLSPFEALLALYDPVTYEMAWAGQTAKTALQNHVIGMCIIALTALIIFYINLTRQRTRKNRDEKQHYTDLKTGIKRRLIFPFYLIDPLKRKNPIGRWRNPVFVAELRSKVFGHPKFILRALSACITLSLTILFLVCLRYGSFLSQDAVRLAAALFQFGVIVFFAPLVSAGSITGEQSGGTMLLLRMTPLSSHTIVLGKLKAAFVYVFIFLLSSIPVLLALAYLETGESYWRIIGWSAIFFATTLTFTLFGLFASSIMRSTVAAAILSYGFALLVSLVSLVVLVFGERISMQVKAMVLALNPLIAVLQLSNDKWFAGYPSVAGIPIWQANLYCFGCIFIVLLIATSLRVWRLLSRRD